MDLPAQAIRCAPHDHILERDGSVWRVWLVEDIVALRHLSVLRKGGEIVGVIEPGYDSVTPPYEGDVYLLLTAFAGEFASRDAAVEALARGAVVESMRSVCRNIARFPAATCEVIHSDGAPG